MFAPSFFPTMAKQKSKTSSLKKNSLRQDLDWGIRLLYVLIISGILKYVGRDFQIWVVKMRSFKRRGTFG